MMRSTYLRGNLRLGRGSAPEGDPEPWGCPPAPGSQAVAKAPEAPSPLSTCQSTHEKRSVRKPQVCVSHEPDNGLEKLTNLSQLG